MAYADAMVDRALEDLKNHRPLAALEILENAAKKNPSNPLIWSLRGQIYHYSMGQREKAADCYHQALTCDPNNLQSLEGLGALTHLTPNQALSLSLFERALEIDPDANMPLILSVAGRLLSACIHDRSQCVDRIRRFIRNDPDLFYLIKAAYWVPFLEIDRELEEEIWSSIRKKFPDANKKIPPVEAQVDRRHDRIRVGYISPNLGDHSIGHITNRLFESHNRDRFEIYIYSTGRKHDQSIYKKNIQRSADRYLNLQGVEPSRAAAAIVDDEIDILVDLNGYMGATQIIEIFSRRPAPVQVYWIGHGGALGLPFYDYIIGDPVVTPAQEDDRYIEAVARLPDFFEPADPHEVLEEHVERTECGLSDDGFVFCAFNNPAKINELAMDTWMEILREVPGSLLWLSAGQNPLVAANLKSAAEERDVAPERLIFADRVPDKKRYFARLRLADLFLDTFTVNAATTAIDAVWAGVPVVTRPGSHFCSRIGASLVTELGLQDLICQTTDDYVKRAIRLARNRGELESLRHRLTDYLPHSILFNPDRFAGQLEEVYTRMWRVAKSRKMPESIDIDVS